MAPYKNVLFLGHDASRTGAPLLLLELIKWLKDNSSVHPHLLLKRGGEIESDYREIATTTRYDLQCEKINRGMHRRLGRRLGLSAFRQPDLSTLYPAAEFPVVWANTVVTSDLLPQLSGPGRRIIHHVHELSYDTANHVHSDVLQRAVRVTDHYIAASNAVGRHLVNSIGVAKDRVNVIHEFPIATRNVIEPELSRRKLRGELKIPDGAKVIGMCGAPHWRKGTDLFVQLAMHVLRQPLGVEIHFVWLGGESINHREALHDIKLAGLEGRCHMVPSVSEPAAYFAAFDLFALTSREDSFSVAMLEAAASGLSVVCFANSGGAPELVEDDAGMIVPYLDVPAMARACGELLVDDKRRRKMGDIGRAKVQSHYTLATQGPKLLGALEAAFSDTLGKQ